MMPHSPLQSAATADLELLLEDAIPQISSTPAAVLLMQGPTEFRPFREETDAFDAALAAHGLAPLAASPLVRYNRLFDRRMPSNVAWTQYPLIGGPFWRAGAMSLGVLGQINADRDRDERLSSSHGPLGNAQSAAALQAIQAAPALIYVGGGDRILELGLHRLLGVLGQKHKPIYTLGRDAGKQGTLVSAAEKMEAAVQADQVRRPLDRFMWNYAANWEGLGLKAMKLCGLNTAAEDARGLIHPWAVQILFAIRRYNEDRWEGRPLARLPRVRNFSRYGNDNVITPPGSFPGMVYNVKTHASGVETVHAMGEGGMLKQGMALNWPGSGRWPPLRSGDQPRAGWGDHASFERACFSLLKTGLVQMPQGSEILGAPVRLTIGGKRLLELLPRGMEDPDMMLRWRAGPGGLPRDEDVPAMDRWINDNFRKLKRRIHIVSTAPNDDPEVGPVSPTQMPSVFG